MIQGKVLSAKENSILVKGNTKTVFTTIKGDISTVIEFPYASSNSSKIYPYSYIPRLPMEFQEVSYIGCDGSQYIDTGLNSLLVDRVIYKINPSLVASDMHIICGTRSASSNAYRIYCALNGSKWYCDWNATANNNLGSATINTDYSIDAYIGSNSQYLKVNDVTLATGTTAMHSSSVLNYMFAWNGNGSITSQYKGKTYYCELYKDSSLVADYVPCYALTTVTAYKGATETSAVAGTIGLYDLVNNRFYINSGSGTFTKGVNVYQ